MNKSHCLFVYTLHLRLGGVSPSSRLWQVVLMKGFEQLGPQETGSARRPSVLSSQHAYSGAMTTGASLWVVIGMEQHVCPSWDLSDSCLKYDFTSEIVNRGQLLLFAIAGSIGCHTNQLTVYEERRLSHKGHRWSHG